MSEIHSPPRSGTGFSESCREAPFCRRTPRGKSMWSRCVAWFGLIQLRWRRLSVVCALLSTAHAESDRWAWTVRAW